MRWTTASDLLWEVSSGWRTTLNFQVWTKGDQPSMWHDSRSTVNRSSLMASMLHQVENCPNRSTRDDTDPTLPLSSRSSLLVQNWSSWEDASQTPCWQVWSHPNAQSTRKGTVMSSVQAEDKCSKYKVENARSPTDLAPSSVVLGLASGLRTLPMTTPPFLQGNKATFWQFDIPCSKRLHNYGKSPFLIGKSPMSMATFKFANC